MRRYPQQRASKRGVLRPSTCSEVTPGTYLNTYHRPIGGLSLTSRFSVPSDLFSDWSNNAIRAGTEVRPSPEIRFAPGWLQGT